MFEHHRHTDPNHQEITPEHRGMPETADRPRNHHIAQRTEAVQQITAGDTLVGRGSRRYQVLEVPTQAQGGLVRLKSLDNNHAEINIPRSDIVGHFRKEAS